ncbi:MAG: hypothetical protein V1720_13905 [bacterium]
MRSFILLFFILTQISNVQAQSNDSTKQSLCNFFRQIINEPGIETVMQKFSEMQNSHLTDFVIDEKEINEFGFELLRKGKVDEGVGILEINKDLFPDSWSTWNSLGDAFWTQNNLKSALECYHESLRLNEENTNAKEGVRILTRSVLDEEKETKEISRFEPGQKTKIKTAYFGQEPPGLTPKVFAPGIISTSGNFEFGCTFSPDGKEFYFTRRPDGGRNQIMVSKISGNCWAAPMLFDSSDYYMENEPYITPDGSKLFFGSYRILPGATKRTYGIWFKERTDSGWGGSKFFDIAMYVSAAANGNIYATDISTPESRGIIKYILKDGKYQQPEKLSGDILSKAAHPCIAPDESFLIVDWEPEDNSNPAGFYISFKNPDGTWDEPIFLGEVFQSEGILMCAYLSPDGKYLFYNTHEDIYWISTDFISELKNQN